MERLMPTYGGNIRDICCTGMGGVNLLSVWAANTLTDLMFHVLHLVLEALCVRVCIHMCVCLHVRVPVEAEVQGELCENEVLRQQAVGLGELGLVLRGGRDQTRHLVQAWWAQRGNHLVSLSTPLGLRAKESEIALIVL